MNCQHPVYNIQTILLRALAEVHWTGCPSSQTQGSKFYSEFCKNLSITFQAILIMNRKANTRGKNVLLPTPLEELKIMNKSDTKEL